MSRSVVVALAAGIAPHGVRADPAVTLEWEQHAAPAVDPVLGLDASLLIEPESETRYVLGPHSSAQFHTTLWSDDRDVHAEGWAVDARVVRDLGWNVSLVLDASLVRAVGGFDREDGTYASVGIALVRFFRLAHKRVAWISLGVEKSSWVGAEPSGLPAGTVVGFHAGVTF